MWHCLGRPKFVSLMYGLPIGFGLGQAWTEAKYLFDHDVKFDRCMIAEVCLSVAHKQCCNQHHESFSPAKAKLQTSIKSEFGIV